MDFDLESVDFKILIPGFLSLNLQIFLESVDLLRISWNLHTWGLSLSSRKVFHLIAFNISISGDIILEINGRHIRHLDTVNQTLDSRYGKVTVALIPVEMKNQNRIQEKLASQGSRVRRARNLFAKVHCYHFTMIKGCIIHFAVYSIVFMKNLPKPSSQG